MPATKRRDFLKLAAAGVAGTSLTPALAATGKHTNPGAEPGRNYDVIVIGGGFAGAVAARETTAAGLHTLLLEAKGRLGGRTFSSEVDEQLIEYGGTWVHWIQPHIWSEIMRYGVEMVETSGAVPSHLVYREKGQIIKAPAEEAWPIMDEAVSRTCARAADLFPRPYDAFSSREAWQPLDGMSIMDGIQQAGLSETQQRFASGGLLGALCSNLPTRGALTESLRIFSLSGHSTLQQADAMNRFKIKHGTHSLVKTITSDERLAIQKGAPVAKIEQDKQGVRITTSSGEKYSARQCIVAVPLNVLKHIEFTPALSPLKLAASQEEHCGKGLKFYAKVRGDLGDILAMDAGDAPIHAVFTYKRAGDYTWLVGFSPGKQHLDVISKNAMQEALTHMLGKTRVDKVLSYDWTVDPFALGTWHFPRPMQSMKYWQALQQAEGRLHFANADSASGWRGFIDGAVERGLRVANDVIIAYGSI